ncbi:MAG TPA: N-methyl-L-tryptophan oxidase [Gemmatimonadales bacterium]|nr:N-methyl-L-tryptophan oxidase [Gemmatimonadales bacterium]
MKTDFEYITLGLGGLGSGAAYWLARSAGAEVLGLEQFELGHVRGESQDHSRIIRLSYHTPGYVRLAKRAYESWDMLAAEAGESCVLKTGGLDVAPGNGAIPLHTYTDSLTAEQVPFERLDAREIMYRWPQWQLTDDCHGIYQADSGIAMAAQANAAHQRMAREHGATLRDGAQVTSVRSVGGEVEVVAGGKAYRCRKLSIAAGPWSNTVLSWLGVELPLEITREQVMYYRSPHLAMFAPERFPVWIWMDDPCFYGFPVFGEQATKLAQDTGGKPTTADTRDFEEDPENRARVERWAKQYLPTALGPLLYTKTCLYTLTPDRDFVIDQVPGHPGISIAIGAGHAFKFASLIGRILSELAIQGKTPSDISPFTLDRPILREKNPSRSYMV